MNTQNRLTESSNSSSPILQPTNPHPGSRQTIAVDSPDKCLQERIASGLDNMPDEIQRFFASAYTRIPLHRFKVPDVAVISNCGINIFTVFRQAGSGPGMGKFQKLFSTIAFTLRPSLSLNPDK